MKSPAAKTAAFYLSRASIYARAIAVILAFVVSARFAVAALSHALDVSTGAVNTASQPRPSSSVMPLPPAQDLTPARKAALAPPPSASASPGSGRSLRVFLSIDYGGAHAEVYVSGRKMGTVPVVAETTCKAGNVMKIEIVPLKGAPLTYERECIGDTIEIRSAPP